MAETTPTVTVNVAGPKGAPASMMTVVAGTAPAAVVVIAIGLMTPGAIMTPAVPGGKWLPVTITAVPRAPAVGARTMLAAGAGVTMKGALAEKPPDVAVMVCTPRGAAASIVTVAENVPAAVVVRVTGKITPGAVMMTGATTRGKPLPFTVTIVPPGPESGLRAVSYTHLRAHET